MSKLLIAELAEAPNNVRELLHTIPKNQQTILDLTDEVKVLGNRYIVENVVGLTSSADCQHIALATITSANVLVSWNFKHIVNLDKIRGYNGVNMLMGYNQIEIRTPKEILRYE